MPTHNKRPVTRPLGYTDRRGPSTRPAAPPASDAKRYALPSREFGDLAIAMIESHTTRANLLQARAQLPLVRGENLTREAEKVAQLDRQHLEALTKFNTTFSASCDRLSIDPLTSSVQLVSDRSGFALLVKVRPSTTPGGTADVPPPPG